MTHQQTFFMSPNNDKATNILAKSLKADQANFTKYTSKGIGGANFNGIPGVMQNSFEINRS
jgi:hypothetical protein